MRDLGALEPTVIMEASERNQPAGLSWGQVSRRGPRAAAPPGWAVLQATRTPRRLHPSGRGGPA